MCLGFNGCRRCRADRCLTSTERRRASTVRCAGWPRGVQAALQFAGSPGSVRAVRCACSLGSEPFDFHGCPPSSPCARPPQRHGTPPSNATSQRRQLPSSRAPPVDPGTTWCKVRAGFVHLFNANGSFWWSVCNHLQTIWCDLHLSYWVYCHLSNWKDWHLLI